MLSKPHASKFLTPYLISLNLIKMTKNNYIHVLILLKFIFGIFGIFLY